MKLHNVSNFIYNFDDVRVSTSLGHGHTCDSNFLVQIIVFDFQNWSISTEILYLVSLNKSVLNNSLLSKVV